MVSDPMLSARGTGAGFSRRDALRLLFLGAVGVAGRANLGLASQKLAEDRLQAPIRASRSLWDVGPLSDSGVDGVRIPQGFGLRVVARHRFNPRTDRFDPFGFTGYPWHKSPDGGACFAAPDGGWVYVSNCESNSSGGAGALRFDADGRVADAYRILDGTRRNCSGGATPWGTWLSCEEVADGCVFECDPLDPSVPARARPALGLFNHEAAAVHLRSRSVFLTEDANDGRLYRFVANAAGRDGRLDLDRGRLQVLEVEGRERGGDLALDFGHPLALRWVDVIDPGMPQAALRVQLAAGGHSVPGTVFRGAEGVWVSDLGTGYAGAADAETHVFVSCKGDNRIYAINLDRASIEPIFDGDQIDPPVREVDNVVVSPAGDMIVAEDGPATRLVVVRPGHAARELLAAGHRKSEITGPAFSPDGSRLYFSSQRGPNLPGLQRGSGVTYELRIPAAYRAAAG